jgi:transcriptional regulator with XRE-family HTH domain
MDYVQQNTGYAMTKTKKASLSLSTIVGKNIRAGRNRKGLTQNQLAQEFSVEVETVSRYERGVIAPSFPQLEKICVVLGIAAQVLFSDGQDVPDARDAVITDSLKELSVHDRDFIRSFVKAYADHQQMGKKRG